MQQDIGLSDGIIFSEGRLFLLASSADLEAQEVEHVFIFELYHDEWSVSEESIEAFQLETFESRGQKSMALLSMFGEVLIVSKSGSSREQIGDDDNGPSDLRPLNAIAQIGNYIYVVGMRRQVYRRHLDTTGWHRIDHGVFIPVTEETVRGFLTVDGFGETEVYAAGFEGEIWRHDGSTWDQIHTTTNLRFESLKCLRSGTAIAVGEGGIILSGRGDSWSVVYQHDVESNLLCVEEFRGELYVCSEEDGIFRIENDRLVKCDVGVGNEAAFQRLYATESELLAVGETAALIYDGTIWRNLNLPDVPGL